MATKRSEFEHRCLTADEVRWSLQDLDEVYETTKGVTPKSTILGQDRALKALKVGLDIQHVGYNCFVCGLTGTGRAQTLKHLVDSLKPNCPLTDDLAYVHNFEEVDRPVLLQLPRGRGPSFKQAIKEMVRSFSRQLTAVMGSQEAKQRRQRIEERYREQSLAPAAAFKEKTEGAGFVIAQVQTGNQVTPDLLYRLGEETVHVSEIDELVAAEKISAEQAAQIKQDYEALAVELTEFISLQQEVRHSFLKSIAASDREAVSLLLEGLIRNVQRHFPARNIVNWLRTLKTTVLDNLEDFTAPTEGEDGEGTEQLVIDELRAFEVNLFLTNRGNACPVIVENNPTYENLFGSFETVAVAPGAYGTDFTRIRAGAMVRAQGGYLVLDAADLLREPMVWAELMRSLRTGELVIQPPTAAKLPGMPRMTPAPIPVNVKILLIGGHGLYGTLLENDMDFAKLFKIKADFDTTIENTSKNRRDYVEALVKIIRDEKLRDFDRSALERVIVESTRLTDSQKRLTTTFSPVADVLREADYHAGQHAASLVTVDHVQAAIEDRTYRNNLFEEILTRQIKEGEVFVETDGALVGQINGLTVLGTLDHEFGKPARITCQVSVGKAGIVNVEREVEMTGSTFDKGLLILQGFMNGRYGQSHAITLSASISFEQSYSYIDGDSASTTEIYVLLSAISGIPLRQDLAVTGSVDQFGRVQPVGGVNQKIEGFYDTCVAAGLTGRQGVLIPDTNVSDLCLSDRVIKAISEGQFHVYPVETIDQGIELLTGRVAGRRLKNGEWVKHSINEAVQNELGRLNKLANESGD